MRCSLLANLLALALFILVAGCNGVWSWQALAFQLVLQGLTNEFWQDLFMLPFKGQHLFGAGPGKQAAPARLRRVARWTSFLLLVLPGLTLAALACINHWGEGSLGRALHLPLDSSLFLPTLAAQGFLFAATLALGLVPLSYRTCVEALMARRERRLMAEGRSPQAGSAPAAAPTHAGVDMLPHGLPEGVALPDCLRVWQPCSPLHARHAELVRAHLREGERAHLSTAPAGVVALPLSSNERLLGGLLLCLAAALLYTALGLFEDGSAHLLTRWAVLLLGAGLLPLSLRVLRTASRRQALLRQTDYFITNQRVHFCRAGEWKAVELAAVEVVEGGSYGEGRGDVLLCPERGTEAHTLVNVEHAEELCGVLGRLR